MLNLQFASLVIKKSQRNWATSKRTNFSTTGKTKRIEVAGSTLEAEEKISIVYGKS